MNVLGLFTCFPPNPMIIIIKRHLWLSSIYDISGHISPIFPRPNSPKSSISRCRFHATQHPAIAPCRKATAKRLGVDVFGTGGTCCPIGNLVESANRCCALEWCAMAWIGNRYVLGYIGLYMLLDVHWVISCPIVTNASGF